MKPKLQYADQPLKDQCQTPAYALEPLLPHITPLYEVVWEPAAGVGFLSRHLRKYDFHVTESELLRGQDFFEYEPQRWDIQVTNPPYSQKYEWLRRSYELGKPFALLLPVETIGAQTAQKLMRAYGDTGIILLNRRINFMMPEKGLGGAGAQFPTLWLCYKLLAQQIVFGYVPPHREREFEQTLSLEEVLQMQLDYRLGLKELP